MSQLFETGKGDREGSNWRWHHVGKNQESGDYEAFTLWLYTQVCFGSFTLRGINILGVLRTDSENVGQEGRSRGC